MPYLNLTPPSVCQAFYVLMDNRHRFARDLKSVIEHDDFPNRYIQSLYDLCKLSMPSCIFWFWNTCVPISVSTGGSANDPIGFWDDEISRNWYWKLLKISECHYQHLIMLAFARKWLFRPWSWAMTPYVVRKPYRKLPVVKRHFALSSRF